MGLMRKAVRRATPRPVKQVTRVVRHPARTAVRAATPKPIRDIQRTAFNVAHPINTAENALINTLMGTPRRRPHGGGGHAAPREYSTGPGSNAAAYERAAFADEIQRSEQTMLSRHRAPVPPATRVVLPDWVAPDPAAVRARIENELGMPALLKELAAFGNPPTVADIEPVDAAAGARELFTQRTDGVSILKRKLRREIRATCAADAMRLADAESERRAAVRAQRVAELDDLQRRTTRLQATALAEAERQTEQERVRGRADHAARQDELDAAWDQLQAGVPDAEFTALRAALSAERVSIDRLAAEAPLVVITVPPAADVISSSEPALTPAGRPTLRKRTKTRVAEMYLGTIASETLHIVASAFAAAPALEAVRCAVELETGPGTVERIYEGTFRQADLKRLRDTPANASALADAMHRAGDARINPKGRTGELAALPPLTCPADTQTPPVSRTSTPTAGPAPTQKPRVARKSPAERAIAVLLDPDADDTKRIDAICDLRERAKPAHRDVLIELVADRDEFVRRVAADALAELEDPRDTPRFEQLVHDPDSSMRITAICAISDRAAPSHRELLLKVLGDSDEFVRRVAADALAELEDPRDTPRFEQLVHDPDSSMRITAICAISDRAAPSHRRLLTNALNDTDEFVRRVAQDALDDLARASD